MLVRFHECLLYEMNGGITGEETFSNIGIAATCKFGRCRESKGRTLSAYFGKYKDILLKCGDKWQLKVGTKE